MSKPETLGQAVDTIRDACLVKSAEACAQYLCGLSRGMAVRTAGNNYLSIGAFGLYFETKGRGATIEAVERGAGSTVNEVLSKDRLEALMELSASLRFPEFYTSARAEAYVRDWLGFREGDVLEGSVPGTPWVLENVTALEDKPLHRRAPVLLGLSGLSMGPSRKSAVTMLAPLALQVFHRVS